MRGLVRSSGADELRAAGVEVLQGDIRHDDVVRQAVKDVDVVYHLAAVFRRAGVPDSEYRSVHVDATRLLLEASAAAGVGRVVHCSTVGVHGDVGRDHPATEDAPLHPGDIYQQTKLEGEMMARETARRVGIPLTVVRPGPIYGPEDRRLFKLIGGVARRRFRLLGDGTPHFQMVYVDDLNEGLRLAGESDQAVGRTYIITGDEAPTLEELVDQIAERGRTFRRRSANSRSGPSGCSGRPARRSASRSASSRRSSAGGSASSPAIGGSIPRGRAGSSATRPRFPFVRA